MTRLAAVGLQSRKVANTHRQNDSADVFGAVSARIQGAADLQKNRRKGIAGSSCCRDLIYEADDGRHFDQAAETAE